MSQDALSLVRNANMTKTEIFYEDNHYIFGPYKFHESTKTCFRRTLNSAVETFYTLRDVIFFLQNAETSSVADYRREAVKHRLTAVVQADQVALKEYVTGVTDTCPQLDLNAQALSIASYATAAAKVTDTSASAAPQISAEELQEQRQRHAALFDESIKAPTQASSGANIEGVSSDKLEELRMLRRTQKRKSVAVDGGLEGLDPAYIQMDKKYLEKLRQDEQAAATRATVLCKPGTDFSFAIKLFNDHILKVEVERAKQQQTSAAAGHEDSHSRSNGGSSSSAAAAAAKRPRPEDAHRPSGGVSGAAGTVGGAPRIGGSSSAAASALAAVDNRKPIIIVPMGASGTISSINAGDLLEDGKYITIEEKRKSGGQREKERYITRTLSNGLKGKYLLVDSPKFDPKDWDRVVAVFVLGQTWQFKDWPDKYAKPVELFSRVLGVHLTMDDRAVDPNVLSWNCKVLKINQFKRHLDAGAVNEFWAYLDDFMRLQKPALYNGLLSGGTTSSNATAVAAAAVAAGNASGSVHGHKDHRSSSSSSSSSKRPIMGSSSNGGAK